MIKEKAKNKNDLKDKIYGIHHMLNRDDVVFGRGNDTSTFTDGTMSFQGDARPQVHHLFPAAELKPACCPPLGIKSLSETAGIATEGLQEAPALGRQIEVIGVADDGVYAKGWTNGTYTRKDTEHHSYMTKIRLSTMTNQASTWTQTEPWLLKINILEDGGYVGLFTIFMPRFELLAYAYLDIFVALDGATYYTYDGTCFEGSLSGSVFDIDDIILDVTAGSTEILITDGSFVHRGNLIKVKEGIDDPGEYCRVTNVVDNTGSYTITLQDGLINSYTAASGVLMTIAYNHAPAIKNYRRGMFQTRVFPALINSGVKFQIEIPLSIADDSDIYVNVHYQGDTLNPEGHVARFNMQYILYAIGEEIDSLCIQTGTLSKISVTPPADSIYNYAAGFDPIPHAHFEGKGIFGCEIVRRGDEDYDTYTGSMDIIAISIGYYTKQLGNTQNLEAFA